VKNLVLTICQGGVYSKLAEFTHPTIKAYAEKIGADFLVISEKKLSTSTSHWEKFQIFDLLNKYERIIYVDTDVLVREDCPNLFELVPKDKLGLFNEAPFADRSKELMIDTCNAYKMSLEAWNGKYYNSGVMVISRVHKYLFKKPEIEYNKNFYEQSYLNVKIAQTVLAGDVEVFDLEYRFNRMNCLDIVSGEDRQASYIIHYAGFMFLPNPVEKVLELINKDLDIWKRDKGNYKYKKHILISVAGGLGDQINAEPAIRFMKNRLYLEDEVIVMTHYPILFKHLDVQVWMQGKFPGAVDVPYYQTQSLPPPESITWRVVSNLMCHTVDFCSMALLKRTLPMADRQVKMEVNEEDVKNLAELVGDAKDLIVVHPGRHWQSKTLPTTYWQEIIDGLSKIGKVCIVGKDDKTRGAVDVTCPEGAIDLRNLTDLGTLTALIAKAKVLLSNDSAPIHIAGAFDNWIVLIPTCKHPDHVLPYRNGNLYYKAMALYKKLPCDEFNSQPSCVHSASAEFTLSDWNEYLLAPDDVVEKIRGIL